MSGKLVKSVLEHAPEDLTAAQMLVLVSIAEDARGEARIARYESSVKDIVRRTRCTPGTVRNALSELAKRGLIRRTHTARQGIVQYYQLADLQDHHRDATLQFGGVTSVTPQ